MKIISSDMVIMFDVDDTLVLWDIDFSKPIINIIDPYDNRTLELHPHYPHIKLLQEKKARGYIIVVWSQGGFAWAEAVVKALNLENYVDLIMSKPTTYVDDLPVNQWLTDRVYISKDSKWKRL